LTSSGWRPLRLSRDRHRKPMSLAGTSDPSYCLRILCSSTLWCDAAVSSDDVGFDDARPEWLKCPLVGLRQTKGPSARRSVNLSSPSKGSRQWKWVFLGGIFVMVHSGGGKCPSAASLGVIKCKHSLVHRPITVLAAGKSRRLEARTSRFKLKMTTSTCEIFSLSSVFVPCFPSRTRAPSLPGLDSAASAPGPLRSFVKRPPIEPRLGRQDVAV
jgi:hypothetical protein